MTCNQKNVSGSDKCGPFITCSAKYVLQMSTYVLLNIAPSPPLSPHTTKGFFRGKKNSLKTYHFSNDYSKTKTEKSNQTNLSVSCKFVTFIAFLPSYFLEESTSVSLKETTIGSFRSKEPENLAFPRLFFQRKNGGMRPEVLKCL